MARECPSCHRVSPVDSPYCPACGAPMTEEALKAQENARANGRIAALLPMRWHQFLIWILLPFELIMGCVDIYESIRNAVQFDAALFRPELLGVVRASIWMNVLFSVVLLPMLAVTELSLLRMQKRGPKMLLIVDVLQAVYGIIGFFLLLPTGADGMSLVSAAMSALEMVLMCVVNHLYYRKREELFQ